MTNGLLIYGEIVAHFLIYYEALPHIWLCNGGSTMNFLIYGENLIFFFISEDFSFAPRSLLSFFLLYIFLVGFLSLFSPSQSRLVNIVMDPLSQLHQMATWCLNIYLYVLLLAAPTIHFQFTYMYIVQYMNRKKRLNVHTEHKNSVFATYWRCSVFLTVLQLAVQCTYMFCSKQCLNYINTCVNVLENLCH